MVIIKSTRREKGGFASFSNRSYLNSMSER
jgi:hypothetical protein